MASECLYGLNSVRSALLGTTRRRLEALYHDNGKGPRLAQLLALAQQRGVPVLSKSTQGLAQLAGPAGLGLGLGLGRHQGVVLLCAPLQPPPWTLRTLDHTLDAAAPLPLLLALEEVQDPGNLGGVVRSAHVLGADAVLLSDGCARLSPVAARASAGALDLAPLYRCAHLPGALRHLARRGVLVLGAGLALGDEEAEAEDRPRDLDLATDNGHRRTLGAAGAWAVWSTYELPLRLQALQPRGVALVMGNEGRGLSRAVLSACDAVVHIPMDHSSDAVDSLNVTVATGIILHALAHCRALARASSGGGTGTVTDTTAGS